MKKKKGTVFKIILIVIILGVLCFGIYSCVPPVRQNINSILHITENTRGGLQKLDSVTNISFDEESKTLSFDEVTNANGYQIIMSSSSYSGVYKYESPTDELQIEIPSACETGDDLNFSVTALGDYVTTKNSEAAIYQYTLQNVSQEAYEHIEFTLFSTLRSYLSNNFGTTTIRDIDIILYNNIFTIKGNAIDRNGNEFNYTIQATLNDFDTSNFESVRDFESLVGSFIGSRNKTYSIDYTSSYTNMTQGLLQSNSSVFSQYINDGYTIEMLQQSNSQISDTGSGDKTFSVNGIYQATKGDDVVTFEVSNQVTMQADENYANDSDYLSAFNEGADATVTDSNLIIYDKDIMKHTMIINKMYQESLDDSN